MSESSEDTVSKDTLVKKDTELYPRSSSLASSPSPNLPDATMVVATTRPNSSSVIPHNHLPNLDQPSQRRVSQAYPLLTPEPYDAGHNIRNWLVELSFFLVDLAPVDYMRYMLRFLTPHTRKVAMTSRISLHTPFHSAQDIQISLFHNQSSPSAAGERLYIRRQAQKTADVFATELIQQALRAFPTLPQTITMT
ncbi:unnamed protein product [Schistocephalus solidus]|uniref:Uncharacterized protein n=1 Tax=Schistocephalus solidus TaxID=70667 RepID=A0A183TSG2_SCHSO|nr:unnamed protein product [Schistocephalus solidus]